jgi:hypothetical protein
VKNEDLLHRVKEKKEVFLHTVERMKSNCIGHILLRNCLLKYVIEGKMDGYK